MLKRYNFFIDVLIFTCGLYSVASLEDNGECLYNVEYGVRDMDQANTITYKLFVTNVHI